MWCAFEADMPYIIYTMNQFVMMRQYIRADFWKRLLKKVAILQLLALMY